MKKTKNKALQPILLKSSKIIPQTLKSTPKQATNEDFKDKINPIDEYFSKIETSRDSVNAKSIFSVDTDNLELKTELKIREIVILNNLKMNDVFLVNRGLSPVFSEFIKSYERLKISLDRKSRGEFVSINKQNTTEDAISQMSNFSNILGSKK